MSRFTKNLISLLTTLEIAAGTLFLPVPPVLASVPVRGTGPVNLSLSPVTTAVSTGSTFDVAIQADCGPQNITNLDVLVDFDVTKLSVTSVTPGVTLTTPMGTNIDNVNGTFLYSAGLLGSVANGTFTVATVRFQTLEVTSTNTSVNFSVVDTLIANGGDDVTGALTGGLYAILEAGDTTPPILNSNIPENMATNIPVTTTVTMVFSEPMNQTATEADFSMAPPVTGAYSWTNSSAMIFTPDSNLSGGTLYTVYLGGNATDIAGNLLGPYNFNFTTVDTTAPTVVSTVPLNSQTNVPVVMLLVVVFSESMNQTAVESALQISPVTGGTIDWINSSAMIFTPDADLGYDATYHVTIGTGATDLNGNHLDTPFSLNFTTAPATLLSLVVTPASPNIALGESKQFTATGYYSNSTSADITSAASWTSDNLTVATIVASGLASSHGVGSANITATYGSVTNDTVLTVTEKVLESIAISPPTPTIAKGRTQQFAATGTYSDSSTINLTASAEWSSSNTTVAIIGGSAGLVSSINTGTTIIAAAYGGLSGNTTLTVGPKVLDSLAITPSSPSIAGGRTEQFAATGYYSDLSTADLTAAVLWTSSNTTVASVTTTGLATGLNTGTTTITATIGSVVNSTVLTVTPAVVDGIEVSPVNPSRPQGRMVNFTANATYSDFSVVDVTALATWTSSDPGTTIGLHTGVATTVNTLGPTTITASYGGASGNTMLTVLPPVLDSISVSPTDPSVAKGKTQQFMAEAQYSNGTTAYITDGVTWQSSNTAVASINLAGLATCTAVGNTTITATQGSITGGTVLNVTPADLVTIIVTPQETAVALGRSEQFTATGHYTDSSTANITMIVVWTTSNSTVASINEGGLAVSQAVGGTIIGAVLGSISDNTTFTITDKVLDSVIVSPPTPSVAKGLAQQFTANGTYSDSAHVDLTSNVTWASSNTTVATISLSGLATANATGSSVITATLGNVSGNTTLTVTAAVPTELIVSPENPSFAFTSGSEQFRQFKATLVFSDQTLGDVTSTTDWVSSNTTVANFTATGGLSAITGNGSAVMNATYSGPSGAISGNTILTVLPDILPPVVTLNSPGEGLITGNTSLAVSGHVDEPLSNVTARVVRVGGNSTYPLVVLADGNFSGEVTLGQGSNQLLITAVDPADNSGTSGTRTIVVSPDRPSVTIASPSDGYLTNSTALTVSGTVSDAGNVTVRLNNVEQIVAAINGTFNIAFPSGLTEGKNVIVAYAYLTGHEGNETYRGTSGVRTVELDTHAPHITINSPATGSTTGEALVNVAGSVDDPWVTSASLSVSGTSQNIPVASGHFNQNVRLTPGDNTITVSATDRAGNPGTSNATLVTFDVTKPVVGITTPVNHSFTKIANVNVTGTVSDPAISTAKLYLNGASQNITVTGGNFNGAVTLVSGVNTVMVEAEDAAHNKGNSGNITMTLDTAPPVLTLGLSDPTDSITFTVSSNEQLNGSPSVMVGVTPVGMTLTGINEWVGTYSTVPSGNCNITASGADLAGNTATQTACFTRTQVDVTIGIPTTVNSGNTTLDIQTNANITGADLTVTQHIENPSGNVGSPASANVSAAMFVEINASPELRDNLNQIYIKIYYDPLDLPAGTDESTLKLYIWDETSGTWTAVAGSGTGVEAGRHYIFGTITHLSKYGVFGNVLASQNPGGNTGGGGGGGGGASGKLVTLSGMRNSLPYEFRLAFTGAAQTNVHLKSLDERLTFDIATGTYLRDKVGNALGALSAEEIDNPPASPLGGTFVMAYNFGPDGATFSPGIDLTLSYDPAKLPAGTTEGEIFVAWWDGAKWQTLTGTVNTVAKTVTVTLTHFTNYALFAKNPVAPPAPPALAPANFSVSGLAVTPGTAKSAETVTVTATVTNSGGSQGKYSVNLKVNGLVADTKELTLNAGALEKVTFTVKKDAAGTYSVDVNGLTGQFAIAEAVKPASTPPSVPEPAGFNWWLIVGLVSGVILLGVVIYLWKQKLHV